MGGNSEPTCYVCRLCGGRIEGHRVVMNRRVRGLIVRTTCAAQGERLDARARTALTTHFAVRMAAECQQRRELARTALSRPIRPW